MGVLQILIILLCVAFLLCWPVRCALGACYGSRPPQPQPEETEVDDPVIIIIPPEASTAGGQGDAPAVQVRILSRRRLITLELGLSYSHSFKSGKPQEI